MWVFLNNAFLSIVDPEASYDGRGGPVGDKLLVRARIASDIEAAFPEAKVIETPDRDYRFRALISRKMVAQVMAHQVEQIGYSNFKGSVPDKRRHDCYMGVWSVMNREQERRYPPRYKARRQPSLPLHDGDTIPGF